jgi:N-formylglutamate amidohydrolase
MFQTDAPAKNPLFTYYAPTEAPFQALVSIPHSGEDVPVAFHRHLTTDQRAWQEDVDFKVHELVDIPELQAAGIGVLVAHVHRICVDLNRAEENCVLFWQQNTQGVPLVVLPPTEDETKNFIDRYHRPYFELLGSLLRDLEKLLPGPVPLVDLHSMPSAPTAYHLKQNPHQGSHRADFCVSDQRGKTCTPMFIRTFTEALAVGGREVAVNDPYIGGFVTTFVDRFRTNNIQIEINRRIYMDEKHKTLLAAATVEALRRHLTSCLVQGLTSRR